MISIKAIQELKKENDLMKEEIANLKKSISQMCQALNLQLN
jgi:HAMP domain-containing protein